MTQGKYDAWTHKELGRALEQAEDDLKAMREQLRDADEERDRFYEESRASAKILGGILRVMADNDMFLEGLGPLIREEELPDVAPALREAAIRGRRSVRGNAPPIHKYAGSNGIMDLCVCGNQWLVQAERCVMQPVSL